MTIENMMEMDEIRDMFRKALETESKNAKNMAIELCSKCCGEFEEQTMIENLREEVLDFYELAS